MNKEANPKEANRAGPAEEREARLRAILDTAVDGIITIDEGGIVESFNPAATRIFGYSPEEVIGNNISMLMPEPYHSEHEQYLDNYLTTGKRKIIGIGREVTGLRKDGAMFPAELAVSELHLGDRVMFTGIIRDISAKRRAELDAQRNLNEHAHASRLCALGEMVSGITHELNQPLAAIVTFADASNHIIKGDEPDLDMVSDALDQIRQQGERAGIIVNRLKDFVKKRETSRATVDINQSIRNALEMTRHELHGNNIAIRVELTPTLPAVSVDRIQIEQVVLNLIQNAIDAMSQSDRRELAVTSQHADGVIEIAVVDSGLGFARDISERMFEAFYTTKSKGTGLGLSISKSIVDAHGGHLSARNHPQGGAEFIFTLPCDIADD